MDRAIEYLNREAKPVCAVAYSPALTILSHQTRPQPGLTINPFDSASSQSITRLDESTSSPEMHKSLKLDNPQLRELAVEFIGCREDLLITTLREFLEIIVMSLLKS